MECHCCNEFIELLKKEVVPALGCTEPIAVAFASANARNLLNAVPEKIEVYVSRNILKNGMGVGVPGTGMTGLDIAAALGAIGGNAEAGLEVLKDIKEEHINLAKKMLKDKKVNIQLKNIPDKLYIEVIAKFESNISRVIIKDKHTNIILKELNGKLIYESEAEKGADAAARDNAEKHEEAHCEKNFDFTVEDAYNFATTVDYEKIKFLLEGAEMNKKVAKKGIDEGYGLKVGKTIHESILKGLLSDNIEAYAMSMTAGGADARMAGCTLPVMSSAGSGNQGLTAILPVVAVAERINAGNEKLARALALSHLVIIHIKSYMGRLSAICGCGVAASIGSSCAITYLMGGKLENINFTIKNMIGNVSGMICDGAKPGCALKLGTAASAAIQSAILALNGVEISEKDGIINNDVEETIKNLGKIAAVGMVDTDKVILDIMTCK